MNSSREIKNHLDQLYISFKCGDLEDYYKMINVLESEFGTGHPIKKYINDKNYSGFQFKKSNFFISRWNKYRCFINFIAESYLYNKLYLTISWLGKRGWIINKGKSAPLIKSAEITFDLPCINKSYVESLIIKNNLSQHLIPLNDREIFIDFYSSGNFLYCPDGCINCDSTTYFHKAKRKSMEDEFPAKSKNMSIDYKFYPKYIHNDLYLREEITLLRDKIKKLHWGYPRFYSQLENKVAKIKFEDYWKYITVNYEMFIDDYTHLVKLRNIPPLTQWVKNVLEYDWEPGRIYMMRWLAKQYAGDYMTSGIRKYIHEHTVNEMYEFIDNALF